MGAKQQLTAVLQDIVRDMGLAWPKKASIDPPRAPHYGDLAANLAMLLSKEAGCPPRELAQKLAAQLHARTSFVATTSIAGPGFLNVLFCPEFWRRVVTETENEGKYYGTSTLGAGRKTLVEYVSANPTGPLHIGHGRGAAVGDALARVLRFVGYDVTTEYYINDAGRQMRLLGTSVWLRARESAGLPVVWPEEYYRGKYIREIAQELLGKVPDLLHMPEAAGKDLCYAYAMQKILAGIKADLHAFRAEHQVWFSERTLVEEGAVSRAFAQLAGAGHSYEEDGALWFATTRLGDDKNRVLRKSDGTLTYFASDIAYHHDKFRRGFDYLIDIWGADHHGYIPRMRAAIQALEHDPDTFKVVLIQLVNLLENGTPISMSTRAGTFETLADVVKEVGTDAARFMFLSRKSDSPLDFDLELVKQRNMENPVYYVQYAHARIQTLLRRAEHRRIRLEPFTDPLILRQLYMPEDLALMRTLDRFGDVVISAAENLAVHHISHYMMELAGQLHSYYAQNRILDSDSKMRTMAQLALLRAVGQVLRNGLGLLGVCAPDSM